MNQHLGSEAAQPRADRRRRITSGAFILSILVGFVPGVTLSYYGSLLLSKTVLGVLSWSIPHQRNITIAAFAVQVTLSLLLVALAIRQVRNLGRRPMAGLFLGFALSFVAWIALGVWGFLSLTV
jgi:hypothetical protein